MTLQCRRCADYFTLTTTVTLCPKCVAVFAEQSKRVNAADSPRIAKREIPVTTRGMVK